MASKVLKRRGGNASGYGLEQDLAAIRNPGEARPIPAPPSDLETLSSPTGGDSFTFRSFTAADAYELGHLLHARLLPFSATSPTLVSISLAAGGQVLFQAAVGSGATPDNEEWVRRKRNAVLRFGRSTWLLNRRFGDDASFRARMGISPERAADYAIHGGGVPIRVVGVEGVVAVVVVSGLRQEEDHAVIGDVIMETWEYE